MKPLVELANEYDANSRKGIPKTKKASSIRLYYEIELFCFRDVKKYESVKERYIRDKNEGIKRIESLEHLGRRKQFAEAKKLIECLNDEVGENYDLTVACGIWETDITLLSILAENLDEFDKLIVDCGCGTGLDLNALASLFSDKEFIGYDISTKQIDAAKKRTSRSGNKNVGLFVGNHRDNFFPLEPNSVDVMYFKHATWEEEFIPGYMEEIRKDKSAMFRLMQSRYKNARTLLKDDGTLVLMGMINLPLDKCRFVGSLMPGFKRTNSIFLDGHEGITYYIASYQKLN